MIRFRIGNGHSKNFKRKLSDIERGWLKAMFLADNGMIGQDTCVNWKRYMHSDVSIFQVTGFISYLHREVAKGQVNLQDLSVYINWMRIKYWPLWVQYSKFQLREAA